MLTSRTEKSHLRLAKHLLRTRMKKLGCENNKPRETTLYFILIIIAVIDSFYILFCPHVRCPSCEIKTQFIILETRLAMSQIGWEGAFKLRCAGSTLVSCTEILSHDGTALSRNETQIGSTMAAEGCPCCNKTSTADSLGHFIFECSHQLRSPPG